VIATCSPPPPCDLASCRTTLPWTIRFPFDFQPWMSASGDAKPKCLSILAAPLFFEETRGGVKPFWTRAKFSSTQLFLLEPYRLVTSHQYNCTSFTPHFLMVLSYSYVCTNTDIDVVFRGTRMCWACKSSALRPSSSALSFLPLICCQNTRPGESCTYTTTPTMSNCYHGSSSDRFHSKKHVK